MPARRTVATAVALAVGVGVALIPTAAHAFPKEEGTISCEIFQYAKGRVRGTEGISITVPGLASPAFWQWGTDTWQTKYATGAAGGSGAYKLTAQNRYDWAISTAYCG
ncbi:hypothetical protein ACFO3K_01850 [Cellulomonas algicola]|uniref:hypothetical protein n=1 Tax=Cellulomonas algicola TaxID=2071633 RepID=UPI001C3F5F35|nr:hypothetical protein [Cellulomonas algicola]